MSRSVEATAAAPIDTARPLFPLTVRYIGSAKAVGRRAKSADAIADTNSLPPAARTISDKRNAAAPHEKTSAALSRFSPEASARKQIIAAPITENGAPPAPIGSSAEMMPAASPMTMKTMTVGRRKVLFPHSPSLSVFSVFPLPFMIITAFPDDTQ